VTLAAVEGRISAAAGRLAPDLTAYEALIAGLSVPRRKLSPDVLAMIDEPVDGPALALSDELALRVEVAYPTRRPGELAESSAPPELSNGNGNRPEASQGKGTNRLTARPLDEFEMRSIEFLERPLWQVAAFQLLVGVKGAGKGTYLAGLAARVTRAGQNVVFVATEDSTEIDLKPRLVAAGAVIERCYVVRQHVCLPNDVDDLRALAEGIGNVGLLSIDPVANHIGDSNSNSEAEVRHAIAPLNELANEISCLIIGVRHPGKDRSRGAVASILGSTAWTDTPRAVVMIAVDDEDPRVRHVQVVAGNRSLNGAAQAFRIDAVPVEGLKEPITLAVELGESEKSVDELIAAAGNESKSGQARELILDILEKEDVQESDALDARVAQAVGLAARTVLNVRTELREAGLIKAVPDKDEFGTVKRWLVARTAAPR